RSSGASPTRTRTDARLSPRSDHERASPLEPHRGALEELGVLALLRLQLAVEAPLGRGLGERAPSLEEKSARPLLEMDGEAQQRDAVGVHRGLDAREDGELRGGWPPDREVRRLEVIAPRERLHVLALHRREAIEELDDLGVASGARHLLRPAGVEEDAPDLDLVRAAHRFRERALGRRGLLAGLERAAADRAQAVREGEAFRDFVA